MTLNQFATKLAKIHNDSGLLYCDMMRDQETLFDVQQGICDLLIEAHKKGAVSQKTLLSFNHVFTVK